MKNVTKWGLSASIIIYGVLHFITYFYEQPLLIVILSLAGVGIFLFSVGYVSPSKLKVPLALLAVGLVVLLTSGTPIIQGLYFGFLQMRNMVGLLIVVPLIAWVLGEEPYMESIVGFGNKLLNTSRKFYLGAISLTQVIAHFLLFGSIQMVHHFEDDILKNKHGEAWDHFKGTPLLRGFALSTLWVISIPSFVFVVEIMDASLYISIIQGFGMAVVGTIVALVFSYFEEKKYGVDITAGLQEELSEVLHTSKQHSPSLKQHLIEFIVLFLVLFGSIFAIQAFVSIELLILIPLAILIFIILYFVYKRRFSTFIRHGKNHVKQGITVGSYQLCVMLGAGIMIYSLNQTNFARVVVDGIYSLQATFPFLNILYLLPFIVIILGFFGLGPLTTMALVGGILGSLQLPYPPEVIVLTVTSGSAISILLSPLIMPVITLSSVNGLSGIKNGIIFNWKYALVLYVIVQVYVQVVVW